MNITSDYTEAKKFAGAAGRYKMHSIPKRQNVNLMAASTEEIWEAKFQLQAKVKELEIGADEALAVAKRIQDELDYRRSFKPPMRLRLQNLKSLLG